VPAEKTRRAAIYARCSTDKHRCRSCKATFKEGGNTQSACPRCGSEDIERGQNPETQLLPLREYASHRGFTVIDTYIDVGISGSRDRRPHLDRLMDDARRRRFDLLLVWRFDRFARSVRHLILALEELNGLGIDFVSMNEAVDTSTPMGRMIFTILGAVAELERSLIRERVQAGVDRAKRQGKKLGRPKRVVDRDRVAALYAKHQSYRVVAKLTGVGKDKIQSIIRDTQRVGKSLSAVAT
jgi:DNA invertase Pin-like site-specific DNA recombinase